MLAIATHGLWTTAGVQKQIVEEIEIEVEIEDEIEVEIEVE